MDARHVVVVETRGVEPLSKNIALSTAPGAVHDRVLIFVSLMNKPTKTIRMRFPSAISDVPRRYPDE